MCMILPLLRMRSILITNWVINTFSFFYCYSCYHCIVLLYYIVNITGYVENMLGFSRLPLLLMSICSLFLYRFTFYKNRFTLRGL